MSGFVEREMKVEAQEQTFVRGKSINKTLENRGKMHTCTLCIACQTFFRIFPLLLCEQSFLSANHFFTK